MFLFSYVTDVLQHIFYFNELDVIFYLSFFL